MAPLENQYKTGSNGTNDKAEAKSEEANLVEASKIEALGGDDYSAALIGVLILIVICVALSLVYLSPWAIAAIAVTIITFVMTRHFALVHARQSSMEHAWSASKSGSLPDTSHLPAIYFSYVLGSGGHTSELCEVIKQQFKGSSNLHRRYIFTSGDTHSLHVVAKLENLIRETHTNQEAGTWDVFRVVRARRVHQPLWTAPYTSILSAISIIYALVQEPKDRKGEIFGTAFKHPHVIVSNGPGTGFIVFLVAHLLKIFYLVPPDRLKMVYIETWAHISTLSLTGKLFYFSDIADLFIVQHKTLVVKTGKRFVGEIAKTGNLLGVKE